MNPSEPSMPRECRELREMCAKRAAADSARTCRYLAALTLGAILVQLALVLLP